MLVNMMPHRASSRLCGRLPVLKVPDPPPSTFSPSPPVPIPAPTSDALRPLTVSIVKLLLRLPSSTPSSPATDLRPSTVSASSMASFAARRDVPTTPNGLQPLFSYVSFVLFVHSTFLTSPHLIQRYSVPRSIRSSHLFLLALTVLVISTLQAVFLPTATVSIYDAKLTLHPAPHVSQDEFTSLATSVLDSIDSISSPAMIMSWSLILAGALLRGAENALRSVASKGRS